MNDNAPYDPAVNSSKSYMLALREIRLGKIRMGIYRPRLHVADEVAAWNEGVRGRRIITGSLTAAFVVVAGCMWVGRETPPATTSVAAMDGER